MEKSSESKNTGKVLEFLKKVLKGVGVSIGVVCAWQLAASLGFGPLGVILTCAGGYALIHYGSKLIKKIKLGNGVQGSNNENIEEKKEEKFFTKMKNKVKGLFRKKNKGSGKEEVERIEDAEPKKINEDVQESVRPNKIVYSDDYVEDKNKTILDVNQNNPKKQLEQKNNYKKLPEGKKESSQNKTNNNATPVFDRKKTEDKKEPTIKNETKTSEAAKVNGKSAKETAKAVDDKNIFKSNVKKPNIVTFREGFEQNRSNIGEYRNVWYNDDYIPGQKYEYKGNKAKNSEKVITDYDKKLDNSYSDVSMAYYSSFSGKQVMVVLKKDGTTELVDDTRLFENIYANLAVSENNQNLNKYKLINILMNTGLLKFVPHNMIYQIEQETINSYIVKYCSGANVRISEVQLEEYMTNMKESYQMDELQLSEYGLYKKINQNVRVRK